MNVVFPISLKQMSHKHILYGDYFDLFLIMKL